MICLDRNGGLWYSVSNNERLKMNYPKTPWAYIWYYVRPYLRYLVAAGIFMVLLAMARQFATLYFSRAIDVLTEVVQNQGSLLDRLLPLFVLIYALGFGAVLVQRLAWLMLEKTLPSMEAAINQEVCRYIVGHSAEFLSNHPSGKLGGRPNQLADNVTGVVMIAFFGFFTPIVNLIVSFTILINVNVWIGLLLFFWSIVLILFLSKSAHRLRRYSADLSEKMATLLGRIVDVVMNALTVKSFAAWHFEDKAMQPFLKQFLLADRRHMHKMQNGQSVQAIIVLLFELSMILLSLYLWHKKLITTGQIMLVVLLENTVIERLHHVLYQLLEWNRTMGRIENALPVVATPHGIQDVVGAKALKIKKAKIEFQNVDFGYRTQRGVLKHFNLTIQPGERVGLVGMSGSGKTTIINLLQRFYDVKGGQILIDGQNIRSVLQDSLHQHIAVIPQDTSLFHRSLYENIAYGNPRASKEAVFKASRQAYAHPFIQAAENGYQTLVGDRGIKLSGGQRQRVAIARAILKQAPILILDEATSALDSESEYHIQKSLKTLMKGKTVIAIAHRLSTLKEMDRIIVMSHGKILEEGTPAQLLKKKGKYAKLWALQTQVRPPQDNSSG